MSVYRVGKYYHYSFQYLGVAHHASTRLEGTERNLTRAREIEYKAKQLVREGNAHLLKLTPMPFSNAAEQFVAWYAGEHRDKPSTVKSMATCCTSLKKFFKQKPVHLITDGDIEDFKTWRRESCEVREVTIRHNLHALGPLFRFAIKHRWAMSNPVDRVDIPSDAESHVMRVLTPAEEKVYFDVAERISQDLYDLGRLMLLQGPRPWCEVAKACVEHVDLEAGTWFIPKTKSNAGKRVLYLTPEAKSILARRISQVCGSVGGDGDPHQVVMPVSGDVCKGGWQGNLGCERNREQWSPIASRQENLTAVTGKASSPSRSPGIDLRAITEAGSNPARFLFPSRTKRSPRNHLSHEHEKALKASGLHFRIYDLRHSFASKLGEKGADAFVIAKILGHNDLRTVLKYVHLSDNRAKEVMRQFGQQAGEFQEKRIQ